MERLLNLKDNVDSSASSLLSLFTPSWRQFNPSTVERNELIKCHSKMKKAIEQFIEFARGSLATAALNGYKKSTSTISKRLQPIEEDSKEIIYNHYES